MSGLANVLIISTFVDDPVLRGQIDAGPRRRKGAEESAAGRRGARRSEAVLLETVTRLDDLRVPPGNRLEAPSGERRGQHSIRVNEQWRICFVWRDGDAYDVEFVDYH